ncbi:hypothetical protein [Metaclostridioides mangenotii]|uniref:hypothetical protein n=1 Tax=Metaclostridioides mangenotii TaxID=1540 RepID=UPI0031DB337F
MGDSRRNSKCTMEWVYISHVDFSGDLYVSNSKTKGGGLVSIRIPIRKIKSQ